MQSAPERARFSYTKLLKEDKTMLHFPFFRPMLCLAPDAGGASGETAVDIPEQQTGQDEAVQDTQEADCLL